MCKPITVVGASFTRVRAIRPRGPCTRGSVGVEGKAGPATLAHGRAVSGAGRARFGITVQAITSILCTDKHGLQTLAASNQIDVCIVLSSLPVFWFAMQR